MDTREATSEVSRDWFEGETGGTDEDPTSLLRTCIGMAEGRRGTAWQLVELVKELADGLIGAVPEAVEEAKEDQPIGHLNCLQRELASLDSAQQAMREQIARLQGALR